MILYSIHYVDGAVNLFEKWHQMTVVLPVGNLWKMPARIEGRHSDVTINVSEIKALVFGILTGLMATLHVT
jgi:hypothetical protein